MRIEVLAEAGFIDDPRCQDALDLSESKRLPDGGWPAEKKYYRVTDQQVSGRSLVNWCGASKRRANLLAYTYRFEEPGHPCIRSSVRAV